MKKLINSPENVVLESITGLGAAFSDIIKVHTNPNFIIRADAPVKGKVALVSGGGSGHEPMHGGFVGRGMLDAACPGAVFTSPTPDQMYEATKAVNGGKGVLHIVKNYTGDVMNFEMAADLARAEAIEVEAVVIDDDVAVKDSLYTAGRRGVGTTVLAEKICGAAAEAGSSLKEVAALCHKVNANGRGRTRPPEFESVPRTYCCLRASASRSPVTTGPASHKSLATAVSRLLTVVWGLDITARNY
jgi:dihydroxyacetone kinase-like protein